MPFNIIIHYENFVNVNTIHIRQKLRAALLICTYGDANCRMRLVENSSRWFARRRRGIYEAAFVRYRRKSIRKTWISAKDALSSGRRIRELSLVPPPTPGDTSEWELWSGERWGLDIRSDVESVTRFSVIESKISLKKRAPIAMHLRVTIGGPGKGREWSGMRGKRGSARASCVKIDLPTEPPRCWNSISLVYIALRIPLWT